MPELQPGKGIGHEHPEDIFYYKTAEIRSRAKMGTGCCFLCFFWRKSCRGNAELGTKKGNQLKLVDSL
jgi:hypothetical protein